DCSVIGLLPRSITLQSVQSSIRILMRRTPLCSIEQANDPCFISDQLAELQRAYNLSACTRNTYLKNLNGYMIWLEKRGVIQHNNLRKAERATQTIREQPCLTKSEIDSVITYLQNYEFQYKLEKSRNLLFVTLLAYTGARKCELLDLNWEDVFQESGQWKIRVSGRKQKARVRYYNCPEAIISYYKKYMHLRGMKKYTCPKLFVSVRTGSPWTSSGVNRFYKRVYLGTGVRFSGHRVRRYVATRLDREGLSLHKISRYLGHQRISTTELYIARSGSLTEDGGVIMEKLL
ncbi:MAG: site-specific integrase, partial [Cyanobacteria bacterium J06649_11]